MKPMTSPTNQSIPFPVQCKVEEIDGTLHLTGTCTEQVQTAGVMNTNQLF
jgi:hypothetical protein